MEDFIFKNELKNELELEQKRTKTTTKNDGYNVSIEKIVERMRGCHEEWPPKWYDISCKGYLRI